MNQPMLWGRDTTMLKQYSLLSCGTIFMLVACMLLVSFLHPLALERERLEAKATAAYQQTATSQAGR